MPFKSEKQRRYLWLKHPDIAKRWADTYPTKKDLPMYADDTKANEKQSMAAQILTRVLPNYLRMFATSGATRVYGANIKKSDSKQEYVKLPTKHGPTFAGESDAQATLRKIRRVQTEGNRKPAGGDCMNNNNAMSPEKQDQVTASALFKKLAVVLSPVLMQEIEDEQAQQQAREAQRMPTNVGVKHTPPAVNSIMPPMGMAQTPPNPGQTQPAQPAQPQQPQQPASGQLASVGGGGSPNSNPINAFGGLSSTGDINGNAALGTQNMAGGEKMAAGALDFLRPPRPPKEPLTIEKSVGRGLINLWRSGQKPAPAPTAPPAPAAAPAYKHWLDQFELAKAAAGNGALAWLTSIDNCNTTADDDLDYVERVKSAVEKWSAACSCGCGDTVKTCKCSATCSCRKPGGSCYKVEKKAGLSTGELIQQSWPIAAGAIGGSLVGNYGPLAVGMRPNTMLGLGGTSLGVGLGSLYNMHRFRNRSKKELKDLRDKKTRTAQDQRNLTELEAHYPAKSAGSPAWQRSAGNNDDGGLNAKGRASYNKATGGHLKAPVTESKPSGSRAKRQNSFCSRMCGMKRVNTGADTKKDPESRINKALRKWNCKCANCAGQPFEVIKSANLERMLTSALVAAGGGLALGSYPGWQLQQASAKAGNPAYVNSFVGRIPIAAAGALSGGLDNYLREQQDEDAKKKLVVPAAHS